MSHRKNPKHKLFNIFESDFYNLITQMDRSVNPSRLHTFKPYRFYTSDKNLLKFYIHYMAYPHIPIIHNYQGNLVYEEMLKKAISETDLFTEPTIRTRGHMYNDEDHPTKNHPIHPGLPPRCYTNPSPLVTDPHTRGWLVGDNLTKHRS
jgi:hypothetical protein